MAQEIRPEDVVSRLESVTQNGRNRCVVLSVSVEEVAVSGGKADARELEKDKNLCIETYLNGALVSILWPGRRELSRLFKYMACARIAEFESQSGVRAHKIRASFPRPTDHRIDLRPARVNQRLVIAGLQSLS